MKIHLVKRGNMVAPQTDTDTESWSKLPDGVIVCDVYRPRNGAFHRWTHAMIEMVRLNWTGDYVPTHTEIMRWLKRGTGLVEIAKNLDTGEDEVVEKSTSFSSMSQDEYSTWFHDLAAPLIARTLGITIETLASQLPEDMPKHAKTYKLKMPKAL